MPSNMEMRVWQKTTLFELLKIQKDNPESRKIKELNDLIIKTKAIMEQEDIAHVEKMIQS